MSAFYSVDSEEEMSFDDGDSSDGTPPPSTAATVHDAGGDNPKGKTGRRNQ